MREIKFRGLTSHSKEWRYGNLAKIDNSYHIFEQCDLTEDGHHIRQDSDRPTWIKEETIGQFTGLYDKNGKEIYEGDVIGNTDINHLIRYNSKRAQFTATLTEYVGDLMECFWECMCEQSWIDKFGKEIIGNIHDNPELLKGDEKVGIREKTFMRSSLTCTSDT